CAPILLSFALHRRCRRVFQLQPVIDPTSAIRRSEPFRHDAFAAKGAGVLKDRRAVSCEMLVKGDTVAGLVDKLSETALAVFEGLPAEIETIALDQVESAEHGSVIMVPVAEQIEHREPRPIDDDS